MQFSRFEESTVARRLTAIILLVTSIVLVLTVVLLLTLEIFAFRRELASNLASTAEVIGTNARPAILYKDFVVAREILDSLSAKPGVCLAYIFDRAGKPLARYLSSTDAAFASAQIRQGLQDFQALSAEFPLQPRQRFDDLHLAVTYPVVVDGELLGTVLLRSDQGALWDRLLSLVFGALLILGAAMIVAYLLAARLQGAITRPILQLGETMRQVADEKNLQVRAEIQGDDELALLGKGFNTMLDQLAQRDADLARYQGRLEELVAQRTAELQLSYEHLHSTNQALDQARVEAEAASLAKSRFLANMSHEIRTPMIGVLGMTEPLQTTPLDNHQRNLVDTVHRSGDALLAILNDILDLAKIEAGKLVLERIPFDLLQVAEEAVDLFSEQAAAKGLELVCDVEPDCRGPLLGDPGRLRQVLLNLIGNAVKFTPSGHVVLKVNLQERSEQQVRLAFEVSDSGIGIAAEAQRQIFDSFSQADDSTSRYYGGSGLGLTIVRDLVGMMGGKLSLESTLGQGTRFAFAVDFPQVHSAGEITPSKPALAGRCALLVERAELTRQVLSRELQQLGLRVTAVASLEQAAAQVSADGFDYLLLDVGLPRDEQLHLLDRLSMTSGGTQPRVLQLGSISDGDRQWLTLRKPVRSSLLAAALSHQPPQTAPSEPPLPAEPSAAAAELRSQVLLAEDNPTTQRLIEIILQSAGFGVVIVSNGHEALAALDGHNFDLVLMDCQMPGMDGLEATRTLRAAGNMLPIVALTAFARQEDADRCFAAGMNDYLRKPFKRSELLAVVDKWQTATAAAI
ncbi:MAG: response regulator [Trichloromonadaceae bacterium]